MAKHFSTLGLTRKSTLDVSTLLREASAAAIAASTPEAANDNLRWHRHGDFQVVITNYAYTGYVEGTAEWQIAIEAALSPTDPFVAVVSTSISGDAGTNYLSLSGDMISQALNNPDTSVLRVNATLVGGAGALTYGAYLTDQ